MKYRLSEGENKAKIEMIEEKVAVLCGGVLGVQARKSEVLYESVTIKCEQIKTV